MEVDCVIEKKKPETVSFPDAVDPRCEIELLQRSLPSFFEKDVVSLRLFVFGRESAWILDASLLSLTERVLSSEDVSNKIRLFRIFGICALKKDFAPALFANDRKILSIMTFIGRFEHLTVNEQKAVILFLCHVSCHDEGRNLLLYVSRRDFQNEQVSNADISLSALCYSMKSPNPILRKLSISTVYNFSLKDALSRNDTVTLKKYIEIRMILSEALNHVLIEYPNSESSSLELARKALKNINFN